METRRSLWADDDAVTECTRCRKIFGYSIFKHHCRKCGLIYCDECSQSKLLIPEEELVRRPNNWMKQKIPDLVDNEDSHRGPKRVCDACSHGLRPLQGELRANLSRCNQELNVEAKGGGMFGYWALPQINYLMQNEITNATLMLQKFQTAHGEEDVPRELLRISKGVVFLTIIKAGFMFTGRYGTGIVVAKSRSDGSWSAPSAITLSGVGWGFQLGAEVTDVMLLLTSDAAVDTFMSTGQVSVGAELGVSVGPVGRSIASDVSAGDKGHTHAFSYAMSQGLFFGASLEATVIASRADVNRNFYGEDVSPVALLCGEYPKPKGAEPLYKVLNTLLNTPTSASAASARGSIPYSAPLTVPTTTAGAVLAAANYSQSSAAGGRPSSFIPPPQQPSARSSSKSGGSSSSSGGSSSSSSSGAGGSEPSNPWVTAPARPSAQSARTGAAAGTQRQQSWQPPITSGLESAEEFGLGGASV